MNHLPRLSLPPAARTLADHSIHFSAILAEVALLDKAAVFDRMKSAQEGLSGDEAATRFAQVGPNVVAENRHRGWVWRLLAAIRNPLVIVLTVLSTISFVSADVHNYACDHSTCSMSADLAGRIRAWFCSCSRALLAGPI